MIGVFFVQYPHLKMFDVILAAFIVFVVIVSIVKAFEIFKYSSSVDQKLEAIKTELYSEIEIQSLLKSRIKLLEGLNTSMFVRISFIVNELMDFQRGILSSNTEG